MVSRGIVLVKILLSKLLWFVLRMWILGSGIPLLMQRLRRQSSREDIYLKMIHSRFPCPDQFQIIAA
jgi:type IV secretory pathway TrbD component